MRTYTLPRAGNRFTAFGNAFVSAMAFLGKNSPGARCAAEVERLMSLTDADLAARGLTRDRVVQHVFGRYRYL